MTDLAPVLWGDVLELGGYERLELVVVGLDVSEVGQGLLKQTRIYQVVHFEAVVVGLAQLGQVVGELFDPRRVHFEVLVELVFQVKSTDENLSTEATLVVWSFESSHESVYLEIFAEELKLNVGDPKTCELPKPY